MNEQSKKSLRERIVTLLRNQKEEERNQRSLVIADKLFRMSIIQKSSLILAYASFNGEVDTFNFMKRALSLEKHIALPQTLPARKGLVPRRVVSLDKDLALGPVGVLEPSPERTDQVAIEDIDAVLVPGIAFDRGNNRLGRGAGYYDRFLRSLPSRIPTIGLAFHFQVVDRLPEIDVHDHPVSFVLTDTSVYSPTPRS